MRTDHIDPLEDETVPKQAMSRLQRIAGALGVPVSILFDPGEGDRVIEGDLAVTQLRDLLATYFQIEDPDARRQCLDLARRLSGDQSGNTDGDGLKTSTI